MYYVLEPYIILAAWVCLLPLYGWFYAIVMFETTWSYDISSPS